MCTEKKQLKVDLLKIRDNKYELTNGEKAWNYAPLMLKYIGDSDSELRDDLIYSTFYQWICERKYFSNEDLCHVLSTVIDEDHLLYHIGNENDDTVFTRTFSALVIALILYKHGEKQFLEPDMFIKVKDNIIKYYTKEQDFRGYTAEKGWAHGAAHGADVLDELVERKECSEAIHHEILDAIKKALHNGRYIFSHEEDERITNVIYNIIEKNLIGYESISNWIEGLTQCCDWERSHSQYITRVNTKNLIRCLYFRLLHKESTLDLVNTLRIIEKKLNNFA